MSTQPNQNTHYRCKNINGTSKDKYKCPKDSCSSWLEHYYKSNPNSTRKKCSVSKIYCQGARTGNRSVAAGGHVLIADQRRSDCDKWMIVPICAACNNFNNVEYYWVSKQVTPVLVTEHH